MLLGICAYVLRVCLICPRDFAHAKTLCQPRSKSLHDTACLGVLAQKNKIPLRTMMSDQWPRSLPVPWHRGSYPDFSSASSWPGLWQTYRLLSKLLSSDVCGKHPCQQVTASVHPRPHDHHGHATSPPSAHHLWAPERPGRGKVIGCSLGKSTFVPQRPEACPSSLWTASALCPFEATWNPFLRDLSRVRSGL